MLQTQVNQPSHKPFSISSKLIGLSQSGSLFSMLFPPFLLIFFIIYTFCTTNELGLVYSNVIDTFKYILFTLRVFNENNKCASCPCHSVNRAIEQFSAFPFCKLWWIIAIRFSNSNNVNSTVSKTQIKLYF